MTKGNRESSRLSPEHLQRLFKIHLQAAFFRAGASLFLWFFILIPSIYGAIDTSALEGASLSVAFLVLMNIPTLWALKYITRRRAYEFFSLLINLLEVIGYTSCLYFVGGLRATYFTPIYVVLVFYIGGTLAPRRFPFIMATLCAVFFSGVVLLEHIGYLPHQNLTLNYDFSWAHVIFILLFFVVLLYVVAFIAAYTSDKLKKARKRLQEQNAELGQSQLELHEAAETLKKKNIQLKESERLKSEFLANMSHEIRTPMNAVIGFADMLLDTDLDEEQIDYIDTIKRSGDSLLALINDILDLSKIEAGELDFEDIDFDPELLAHDVCEVIRPKVSSKSIEILCRIGDELPSQVRADPLRFRQVLTNLMGNAAKFTDSGEIELSLDIEEERDDRTKLHATIRDTGIGIPEEKVDGIFDAFQQADGSTTRKFGGTGLGLTICRQISKILGGEVWAESQVGKGSAFHFTAWLGKTDARQMMRITRASLAGKRILVVDDNQTNLEILTHILESAGIRVVAENNAEGVMPALKDAAEAGNPFDVCLSDINMPSMSGYDLISQIRDPGHKMSNLAVIAISSVTARHARKCEEAGFDGFLSKPIHRQKLYQMLERILGERAEGAKRDRSTRPKIMTQYTVREDMKHSVNILLAEDNPVNQKLAKLMLTRAGYKVGVANDGKDAIEQYTTAPERFDVILMDIEMPEMDGFEATRVIRQKGFATVPIIAMTAHAMKGDREKCLEAGMNDYITKPIKRELVFEILEKYLFRKKPI